MSEILKVIQERQSLRVSFDPNRPVSKEHLMQILEAGRWAPTAHNMQNFEVVVVDDKTILDRMGRLSIRISEVFLRENYENLSFSEAELARKKVGILGSGFPSSWVDPAKLTETARDSPPMSLAQYIRGSSVLLVVLYDPRRRAPASEGDILGFMSLGCVMENMWLMAQSLGIGLQILSTFATAPVEKEIRQILQVPEHLKIAYTVRLGYPVTTIKYLRVRRDVIDFAHHNNYLSKDF